MRRTAGALLVAGLLLATPAAAWRPVMVPRLVKFPTNVNRTDHYAGTMVTYLDRTTGATLASPSSVPLTLDRHLQSVPGGSSSRVSLVKETITAHIGDQTTVQENVYAVDRRTMENVADPRAFTFTPDNVLDRSGTYYLTMPMDLKSSGEKEAIWKPEGGASYSAVSASPGKGSEGDTKVVYLQARIDRPMPVPDYELAVLKQQGLPTELTPQQVTARLTAAGVDVAAVAPVLLANLTADELKVVTDALAQPVPLRYFVFGHGVLAAEPTTGALVKLDGVVDGIEVQPDMSAMAPVVAALGKHADVPAIASLVNILRGVANAAPQPAFELRYTQTPESVADAGAYARSKASKVRLARTTIPLVLAGVSAVLLVGFVVLWRLGRRRPPRATEAVVTHEPRRSAA